MVENAEPESVDDEPAPSAGSAPSDEQLSRRWVAIGAGLLLLIGVVVGTVIATSKDNQKPSAAAVSPSVQSTTAPTPTSPPTVPPTAPPTVPPTVSHNPPSTIPASACPGQTPATVDFITGKVTSTGMTPAQEAACEQEIFGTMKSQADQSVPEVRSCEQNVGCMTAAASSDFLNQQAQAFNNATASMQDTWVNGW
jgi:hypothetical protein